MADLRLWYVYGNGVKSKSPLSEGCHFAAWSKEECAAWLLDNYPEMVMLNGEQFSSTAIKIPNVFNEAESFWMEDSSEGVVDGIIRPTAPDESDWQIAMCFLK